MPQKNYEPHSLRYQFWGNQFRTCMFKTPKEKLLFYNKHTLIYINAEETFSCAIKIQLLSDYLFIYWYLIFIAIDRLFYDFIYVMRMFYIPTVQFIVERFLLSKYLLEVVDKSF